MTTTLLDSTFASNAVDFLIDFTRAWPRDSFVNICHISSEEFVGGRSWLVTELDEERKEILFWIADLNRREHNIYWTPNPVTTRLSKKPQKTDILACHTAYIDIDPHVIDGDYATASNALKERARDIVNGGAANKPQVVVHSGNGLHVYWHAPDGRGFTQDDGEAVCRTLHAEVTGNAKIDGTWNCDRLLRLPFTLNWPNAKKLAAGYPAEPSTATLQHQAPGTMALADWEVLRARAPASITQNGSKAPRAAATASGTAVTSEDRDDEREKEAAITLEVVDHFETIRDLTDFEELPTELRLKFREAADSNKKLKARWGGKHDGKDDSGSYFEASLTALLHKEKFSRLEILSLLWVCPHTSLRSKYLELGHAKALRRFARVILRCGADTDPASEVEKSIFTFNSLYAHVWESGQDMIVFRTPSKVGSFDKTETAIRRDFVSWNSDKKVLTGHTTAGEPIYKPAAQVWLDDPRHRKCAKGFVMDPSGKTGPDYYNRWMGYSEEPKVGDWSLMREHIRKVIAAGNQELDEYVMGWIAWMFQNPTKTPGVALVLRGEKGTGKTTLGEQLCRIWGSHGTTVQTSKHLTGEFNAHLGDCIFLLADEAFFAGARSDEGVLKALITSPVRMAEPKKMNAYQTPNYLHIMMTTNSDWAVPASGDERRYACLDVSNCHKDDQAYFAALYAQMDSGGRAAMSHDMLNYDLSRFNVRKFPETDALKDQRTASLQGVDKWLFEVIERGYLVESSYPSLREFPSDGCIPAQRLHVSYAQWAKNTYKVPSTAIGKLLVKLGYKHACQKRGQWALDETHGSIVESRRDQRVYVYELGTVDDLRQRFAKTFKVNFTKTIDMPEDEDESPAGASLINIKDGIAEALRRQQRSPRLTEMQD